VHTLSELNARGLRLLPFYSFLYFNAVR
jgi:hypothetical protein